MNYRIVNREPLHGTILESEGIPLVSVPTMVTILDRANYVTLAIIPEDGLITKADIEEWANLCHTIDGGSVEVLERKEE